MIVGLLMALGTTAFAQQIQLHYDLGRDLYDRLSERPKVTTNVLICGHRLLQQGGCRCLLGGRP